MKFTINRLEFLKLLNTVSIALLNKSPTPAYLNFKIVMSQDKLTILSSNGDLTISSSCPVMSMDHVLISDYEEGETLITGKFLLDIIRKLDSEVVTIEIIDEVIARISDSKSDFKLNAMRANEYPDLDLSKEGVEVKFEVNDLKRIISQTAFAASTKEVRPVLTAVNVVAKDNQIQFVATDSYRLAKKVYNIDQNVDFTANIPVKTLNEVSKLLEEGEVKLIISHTKVIFVYKDTTIYSRLIAGDFPRISSMFPSSYPYVLQVNAANFISSMERASLLAIDRENIVKLEVSSEKLEITSKSEQIGSAKETIEEYRYSGDRFEIAFNVNYVIDALKAAQSEDVILSFVNEIAAFKVTSIDDETIVQIVTPVRSYY